ncbi:hypothetical protein SDAV_00393 [Spiroplasma phoeniceum P40]|uniref:Uncharacterized protein n=1 Tax=Spiroplasma phoeniceum P40 TaxID=1276259 RepID=A0A345DME9_9MOLU|nr:hypothetical protein SDAV_00393 [Spiroplasma phoeniceum P40]
MHIRESDISHIDVFNEYFAVIYGNLCEEKIVVSFRISKKKVIFNIINFNLIKKFITKKDKTNSEYHFLNQANEQSSLDHNKNLDINLIEHDNNFTKLT